MHIERPVCIYVYTCRCINKHTPVYTYRSTYLDLYICVEPYIIVINLRPQAICSMTAAFSYRGKRQREIQPVTKKAPEENPKKCSMPFLKVKLPPTCKTAMVSLAIVSLRPGEGMLCDGGGHGLRIRAPPKTTKGVQSHLSSEESNLGIEDTTIS